MNVSKSRIAVAVVLLLALTTPLQAAAPKAGAKCTKAGSTATASGKKFTCIKSGTKLVWNKKYYTFNIAFSQREKQMVLKAKDIKF